MTTLADVWTTPQAAEWYGCTPQSLRAMLQRRGIPPVGIAYLPYGGKVLLYRIADVQRAKDTARRNISQRVKRLQTKHAIEKSRRATIRRGIAHRRAKRVAA